MINLTPPSIFNFQQTIQTLQRGADDPINIISEKTWIRAFRLDNEVALIQTTKDKRITSNVLLGKLESGLHKSLIKEALGLDDPILRGKVNDIPYQEKIAEVMGLAVPGYPDLFEAIVQIIMGQQVSVVVANKVRAIFTHQFGGSVIYNLKNYKHFPHPEVVMQKSIEALRALGLSQTKAKSIVGVSRAFMEDENIHQFTKKSDSNYIRNILVQLYGVGDWTVDWLLLRGFRRFEIIPNTDLAVRKAFTWWLNKQSLMSADAVKRYEKKLSPYGGAIAYRILCAYSKIQKRKGDVELND